MLSPSIVARTNYQMVESGKKAPLFSALIINGTAKCRVCRAPTFIALPPVEIYC
jgi:hypothetical protein